MRVAQDIIANLTIDILRDTPETMNAASLELAQQRRVMFLTLVNKLLADVRATTFHLKFQRKLHSLGYTRPVIDRRIGAFTKQPKTKTLISREELAQLTKDQLAEDARLLALANEKEVARHKAEKRAAPPSSKHFGGKSKIFRRDPDFPRSRGPEDGESNRPTGKNFGPKPEKRGNYGGRNFQKKFPRK